MAAILVYRLEDERVPPALASLRRGYRKIQTSVNRKSLKKSTYLWGALSSQPVWSKNSSGLAVSKRLTFFHADEFIEGTTSPTSSQSTHLTHRVNASNPRRGTRQLAPNM